MSYQGEADERLAYEQHIEDQRAARAQRQRDENGLLRPDEIEAEKRAQAATWRTSWDARAYNILAANYTTDIPMLLERLEEARGKLEEVEKSANECGVACYVHTVLRSEGSEEE
jgi:hypothetical protein